jgi:predicted nucleic acid-binding protein
VTRFVIDASIAIKWVIDEAGTEQALLLRRHRLSAPDLLVPECSNILWKKARRGELTRDEAIFAARLLQRADVELEPMRRLWEPATRLALSLDHPAYDCIYLALAQALSCAMVTADERLYRKIRRTHGLADVLNLAAMAASGR